MARNFDQILAEVSAKSDPQRKIVLNQISQLPTQQAADEAALDAKLDQASQGFVDDARRRGIGFSGIPIAESEKYKATDYAPALANLKASYGGRRATLESALADVGKSDYMTAQDIFARDRAFDYQVEQDRLAREEAQRAASASTNALASLFGNSGNSNQVTAKKQQRSDGGFNFQGPNGQAISAAQYSQLTGIPFRKLLQEMADRGDKGAAQALGFVGDDYGYNRTKVGSNQQLAQLINSLLWGVNKVPGPAPANLGGGSGVSVGVQASNNVLRALGR